MVAEIIDSENVKLTVKCIPIKNSFNKITELSLQNGDSLKLNDPISFTDYSGNLHTKPIIEIKGQDFTFNIKILKSSLFKELIVPMYFLTLDHAKYDKVFYDVVIQKDTVVLKCFFNYDIDSYITSNHYFNSYKTVNGMCLYEMYIPEIYKLDYEFIKSGLYSKTSGGYKSRALSFFMGFDCVYTGNRDIHKAKGNTIAGRCNVHTVSKLNAIFNKSKELKESIEKSLKVDLENGAELASKPIIQYN